MPYTLLVTALQYYWFCASFSDEYYKIHIGMGMAYAFVYDNYSKSMPVKQLRNLTMP